MRTKKTDIPSLPGFLLKLAAALCLILFTFLVGTIILETISENNMDKDSTTYMEYLDSMFYKQDYTGMREEMELFDLTGDEFATYREIVDGYTDYLDYEQWRMTSEEMVPGSGEKAEIFKKKVIENADNCQFSRNQKQLNVWKDAVTEE